MNTEAWIWTLLLAYAAVLLVIALWESKSNVESDDYLLASRGAGPLPVAASIFTLIGGGEFATMALLGFLLGVSGISLFVGYAAGFIFLAACVSRIRGNNSEARSLPDFLGRKYGNVARWIGLVVSFLAFFALLLLQFSAIGAVLQPFVSLSYPVLVIVMAAFVTIYVAIGGLRAVLITDVFQAMTMVGLTIATLWILNQTGSSLEFQASLAWTETSVAIGLALTGFFVAIASADVWQRVLVAKSDSAASVGLGLAAAAFVFFGVLLVLFGTAAKTAGVATADTAFVDMVTNHLPLELIPVVVLMITAAIMSTADTEIFLLASLASDSVGVDLGGSASKKRRSRLWVLGVATAAAAIAIVWSDLVAIYTWVLNLILLLSPTLLLLWKKNVPKRVFYASFLVTSMALFVGAALGLITLDNAYMVVFAGIAAAIVALAFTPTDR